MKTGLLPLEVAVEPNEEAKQPLDRSSNPDMAVQEQQSKKKSKRSRIVFETSDNDEIRDSQSSSIYKDVLSQPASHLTHKARLQWLQKRRAVGLWVQCDGCQRWRYLPDVLDSHELAPRWYCRMHTDREQASCSVPEQKLRVRDEEDLIHSEYSAGSLVWARMQGWPFWPAMVDDDPDIEQFYWLDGFSDIPTYYNVVFFDKEVTRAWISPDKLRPYTKNKKMSNVSNKVKRRFEYAVKQANDAAQLAPSDRLAKYSFIARYEGKIGSPINPTKKVLQRFQKKLERMYNIEIPIEIDSDDDETVASQQRAELSKALKNNNNVIIVGANIAERKTVTDKHLDNSEDPQTKDDDNSQSLASTEAQEIKNKNVIIVGTPKRMRSVVQKNILNGTNEVFQDSLLVDNTKEISEVTTTKEFDSMNVQLSTQKSDTSRSTDVTSKDLAPEPRAESSIVTETQDLTIRIATPSSDDFDF